MFSLGLKKLISLLVIRLCWANICCNKRLLAGGARAGDNLGIKWDSPAIRIIKGKGNVASCNSSDNGLWILLSDREKCVEGSIFALALIFVSSV